MARGKNIDKEYFPPVHHPKKKVEQLIAWPRREKMKTQGEKIKTGGKISYILPKLKYSAQILSQKKILFNGKNMI